MEDQAGFTLNDGFALAGVTLDELWWRYAAFGGMADVSTLGDRIADRVECSRPEQRLIAQALNECFLDLGLENFPVAYGS